MYGAPKVQPQAHFRANAYRLNRRTRGGQRSRSRAPSRGGPCEAVSAVGGGGSSINNLNLIYWKTTKNFEDGCSAHLKDGAAAPVHAAWACSALDAAHGMVCGLWRCLQGYYSGGNLALPDHAAFLMENVHFDGRISLEANHHCNEGVTGVLCRSRRLPSCCGHAVRLLYCRCTHAHARAGSHTHTRTRTHTRTHTHTHTHTTRMHGL